MKNIEEQLESIEEVLSIVIRKNASIENLIQSWAESQNEVLTNTLAGLKSEINNCLSISSLASQLSEIQKEIERIPHAFKVKNYHHFDFRSKGFIISAVLLLIVTALSVAVAISSYGECSRLRESNLKFRIARQLSPTLAAQADSIYYRDPDRAELETQRLEAHELSVKEAEQNLNQRQMEAKKAQDLLRQLKRK